MENVDVTKAFDNNKVIKLVNGEEVTLPRLTIGKIMVVTDAVSTLINAAREKVPNIAGLIGADAPEGSGVLLAQALPAVIPVLMNEIVNVLAKYLGKDHDWIKDQLDMEDLVNISTPFFADIFKQGNHVAGALAKVFPAKTISEPQSQNSQTSSQASTDGQ